jgi:4-hydroxyphenylacetate 3-monooxygenase
MRNGADYLESVRDGRRVLLDGKLVDDVTTHPAFANATRAIAGLYDTQCEPEQVERMTFESPTSGRRVGRMWQLPKNYEELVTRRLALTSIAEQTCGMMGRSPDHVASVLSGMVIGIDVFERYDRKRAQALLDYFDYARDKDLYLSYVIINPQADKSKSASGQPDEYLVAGICDEDAEGITIKGAKMLGTGAVLSNEVLVAGFQVYGAGDEKYAFTAMVPINAKGVKLLSRRSYAQAAPSTFDYPLSSLFDENDALIYFDEVKIPWHRVFIHRDIKMAQAQWHETWSHVYQNYQCAIRLTVKLRFLLGIARKIAETNAILEFPQVRETMGELAAKAGVIEGLVKGMEAGGHLHNGYFVPDKRLLCSAQVMSQTLYPEIVNAIRQLAGGGVIMLPSSYQDFLHEETAELIGKTQKSPLVDSEARVKLFKLAWDALGSEFGSRHLQYEMFYSGPAHVTRGHAFRHYDWNNATGLVDELMNSYGLPRS